MTARPARARPARPRPGRARAARARAAAQVLLLHANIPEGAPSRFAGGWPAARRRLGAALAALALATPAAAAEPLTILSWGGAFTAAQETAMAAPFTADTGIPVRFVDADDPALPLAAQVAAGNVTADLASVGVADATRLCDEGIILPLDPAALAPGANGESAADDFVPGGLGDCFVATDVYATIIAFDHAAFAGDTPRTLADFFDTGRFPGRRGLLREPRFTLEMALMADGVPAADVYATLSTPHGLDRAFAKLDTLREDAVWWEAGAQPPQLLGDGEVTMTMAYNGRIFTAVAEEDRPFTILWHGQVWEVEGWVIPRGAPNEAAARAFVAASTTPQALADFAMQISYGPPRRSAAALVGAYRDSAIPMAPHLPTAPENMATALAFSPAFWADNLGPLNERFAAWLAR